MIFMYHLMGLFMIYIKMHYLAKIKRLKCDINFTQKMLCSSWLQNALYFLHRIILIYNWYIFYKKLKVEIVSTQYYLKIDFPNY